MDEFLDAAEDWGGRIDFIRDFAVPLPVTLIAQMLKNPVADRSQLLRWSNRLWAVDQRSGHLGAGSDASTPGILDFAAYFRSLIEHRRRRPGNDIPSDLVASKEANDHLSSEDLAVHLVLRVAAGHGTTTNLLGNGLLALLCHPDQWALLVAEQTIAESAVNEIPRFDAPVQATVREVLEDVSLRGKSIRKGQPA